MCQVPHTYVMLLLAVLQLTHAQAPVHGSPVPQLVLQDVQDDPPQLSYKSSSAARWGLGTSPHTPAHATTTAEIHADDVRR